MILPLKRVFTFAAFFLLACTMHAQPYATVSARFNRLSNPVYFLTPGEFDAEDDLRFKQRLHNSWSPVCAQKLWSNNPVNNLSNMNVSGGNITVTVPSASFTRYFQFWEEDGEGGECDYNTCGWPCKSDERNYESNESIDLVNFASGQWVTSHNHWNGDANQDVYYDIKFDMPAPNKPVLDTSGIPMVCSGREITIKCLNNNLPFDFDHNEVRYQFEYSTVSSAGPFQSLAFATVNNTVLVDIPQRNTRGQIYFKVKTKYRSSGEWGPYSEVANMDVLAPAPTFSGVNLVKHVNCHEGIDGSLEIKGLSSVASNRYTLIAVKKGLVLDETIYSEPKTDVDVAIPNLPAGEYIIVLKTGNGSTIDGANFGECNVTIPSSMVPVITAPGSLPSITDATVRSITGTSYHVDCIPNSDDYQSNGIITLTAIGGTLNSSFPNYRYFDIVNFGLTLSPVKNLSANFYSIQVMDANNCISQFPFLITVSSPPIITLPGTNQNPNRTNNTFSISCFEGSNGALSVQTNSRGNVGDVQYRLWSQDNSIYRIQTVGYNAIANFAGLPAGAYKIKATDSLGCTIEETNSFVTNTTNGLYLNQPSKLEIVTVQRPVEINSIPGYNNIYNGYDVGCSYTQNGYVNVVAQGGISFKNYTYNFTGGPGIHNTNPESHFYNLHQKTDYIFTVRDDNGCTTAKGINLNNIPDTLKVQSLTKTLYNGFHISCNTENSQYDANGSVSIVGVGGVWFKPFTYQYLSNAVTTNTGSVQNSPLPGDVDGHGRIFKKLPWNYNDYQLTDNNGCVLTGNFFLEQPSQLSVTGITTVQPNCHHYMDGQFTITLAGGVFPQYQSVFQQKFGTQKHEGELRNPAFETRTLAGANLSIDGVDMAKYKLSIRDVNGCTLVKDSIPMTEPDSLTVTNLVGFVPCKDGLNGRFTTLAKGGIAPYQAWLDGTIAGVGSPLLTFTGLRDHTYSLHLTDAHGCYNYMKNNSIAGANVGSAIVSGPPAKLEFYNVKVSSPTCYGFNDGTITPSYRGGYSENSVIRYSLNSSNYIDFSEFNNVPAGSHRIALEETNAGGLCIITTTVGIAEKQPLSVTGIAKDIACYNEKNGMIILSATGGNGEYLYSVTGESLNANATFTGLDVKSYQATVKDKHNCPVNTLTFAIAEPPLLEGNFDTHFSTCGDANGSITFSGTGGTQPYSFIPLTPKGGNSRVGSLF